MLPTSIGMPSTERTETETKTATETETQIQIEIETELKWKLKLKLRRRFVSWLSLANCERMCGKVFWKLTPMLKIMLNSKAEATVNAKVKAIACYWNRSKLIYHQAQHNIWDDEQIEDEAKNLKMEQKLRPQTLTKVSVTIITTKVKIKINIKNIDNKSKKNTHGNNIKLLDSYSFQSHKRKRSKLCLSLSKNYLIYLSIGRLRDSHLSKPIIRASICLTI